jgi:cytoskeletal protein RodZ
MGVSLEDAAAQTHLRETYLTALEGDDVDALGLDPAYVRGTLRTYADYLGLDATSLLARYRANGAQTAGSDAPEGRVKPDSASDVDTSEPDTDDQPAWHRMTRVVGGVVGLMIIAVVAFAAGEMLARRTVLPVAGGQQGQHESIWEHEPAAAVAEPLALKLEFAEETWVRVTTDDQTVSPPYAGRYDDAVGSAFSGGWQGPITQEHRRSVNVVCDAELRCRVDQ